MARPIHINVPDHVENEQAYIKAATARIQMNRLKGARAKWLAASPNAQRCIDFLTESGEFEMTRVMDEDGYWTASKPHPLVKASYGQFYSKMCDTMNEWGALTEKQEAAVLGMIEKAQERIDGRAAAHAAEAAASNHVGEVGKRQNFEATIAFITSFEGNFGYVYITGMKDDAGNVLIYKGSNPMRQMGVVEDQWGHKIAEPVCCAKGDRVSFKATIKAHGERDGVKQTMLSRPVPNKA